MQKECISKFKKLIYDFIWNGKPDKVQRTTLCKEITDGGLKMIDIDRYIDATKIKWVKQLTTCTNEEIENWKVIPKYYFDKFGKDFLLFHMNLDSVKSIEGLPNNIPSFYIEILKTWIKSKERKPMPDHFRSIRQEIIWGNQYIKLNGKCLVFNRWIGDNILYINDILDQTGKINEHLIKQKLSSKANWMMEILKIKKAIPKRWLNIIATENSIKSYVKTDKTLKFANKILSNLKAKDIYKNLEQKSEEKPIGFIKWGKDLNIDNCSNQISCMCLFIKDYLEENKLKEFRWKLIHYIIPSNKLLKQWRVTSSSECNICQVEETYDHYFLTCRYFQSFWNQIHNLFIRMKLGRHILTLKNLVLGYKIKEKEYYDINYLLTIIMFTIYKCYCVSDHKNKNVDVYSIFRKELVGRYDINVLRKVAVSKFIKTVVINID